MKTCPVCGCVAFDDASVCFGCLHPFGCEAFEDAAPIKQNRDGESPSRFMVTFEPKLVEGKTSWTCSVEQMPTLA